MARIFMSQVLIPTTSREDLGFAPCSVTIEHNRELSDVAGKSVEYAVMEKSATVALTP